MALLGGRGTVGSIGGQVNFSTLFGRIRNFFDLFSANHSFFGPILVFSSTLFRQI